MVNNDPATWSEALHDATLVKVTVDWAGGILEMDLRRSAAGTPLFRVTAKDVREAQFPRYQPWGRSSSVNQISCLRGDDTVLEMQMQSGDVILIRAASLAGGDV